MSLKDKVKRIPAPKIQAHIKFIRDPSKPDWSGLPGKIPTDKTEPGRASDPKSRTGNVRS